MKLAVMFCNRVLDAIDKDARIDGTSYLKRIKKELGARIRDRGRHLHQGGLEAEEIFLYQVSELMHETGDHLDGWPSHAQRLKLTRRWLCDQIDAELPKMEKIVRDFLDRHAPALVNAIKLHNELLEGAVQGQLAP